MTTQHLSLRCVGWSGGPAEQNHAGAHKKSDDVSSAGKVQRVNRGVHCASISLTGIRTSCEQGERLRATLARRRRLLVSVVNNSRQNAHPRARPPPGNRRLMILCEPHRLIVRRLHEQILLTRSAVYPPDTPLWMQNFSRCNAGRPL